MLGEIYAMKKLATDSTIKILQFVSAPATVSKIRLDALYGERCDVGGR